MRMMSMLRLLRWEGGRGEVKLDGLTTGRSEQHARKKRREKIAGTTEQMQKQKQKESKRE